MSEFSVSARELHKTLNISTRFNDWANRKIVKVFKEDVDYQVVKLDVANQVNYLMLYHTELCGLEYVFEDRADFLKWVEENRECGYSQLPYPEHHIDTDVRLWYPCYD